MADPAHLNLFKARLQETTPHDALFELARQLRDGGSTQVDLFVLFSYFQRRLSPEDPRYDAVVDNMDLICGGAWAKGRALFPVELDPAAVQADRVAIPTPWVEIGVSGDVSLERELARELAPDHLLANCAGRALMKRGDRDDVLFAVLRSPQVALVHLTWSGLREGPGFPSTRVFVSMLDWYEEIESDLSD